MAGFPCREDVFLGGGAGRTKGLGSADVGEGRELPVPDEEELLEALTSLQKARAEVSSGGGLDQVDFAVRVRGRVRPHAIEEAGAMALQAVARADLGRDFCHRRHLQSTFKCTWAAWMSEANAGILRRAWCHRMQFFLDAELSSDEGAALTFTDDLIASYIEPIEMRAFPEGGLHARLAERVRLVRRIPFA